MKIVFIGTALFAVSSLQALYRAGHQISQVISQPDRAGNRLRLTMSPVKIAALELGLEVFQPEHIAHPQALDRLRQGEPELLVLAAYSQIIPRSVLELAPRGVINVHPSLLPSWRGSAPIVRALLAGESTTGVTIMQMDERLDHGPILAKVETEIGGRETALQLTDRLAELGASLLVETLKRLDSNTPQPQEHAQASYAKKLTKSEGDLNWELSGELIDRYVRGLQPWPGVVLPLQGRKMKVLQGRPLSGRGQPGEILRLLKGGVEVACGEGSYLLEQLQLPGGRPGPARSLIREIDHGQA
ncbi:MAG: methionyl-tRNA formyltransferase [Candidatus Dormibacteraceae bacterium]